MRLLKTTFTLCTAVVISACAVSQPIVKNGQTENLYKGIEFQMPRVNEPKIPDNSASITDFGAKSGGQYLCTQAFANAIDAVSKKGGGKVIIPRGLWLTGPIALKSNIEIHSETGAMVVFSTDKNLYPLVETIFEGFGT
ncbi:MAG TPA: glycoside hydrolase family 28 protein, partial [Prolixibacteraceae bacterium]